MTDRSNSRPAATAARIAEAYCRNAVRLQCNPAALFVGLLIFALPAVLSMLAAQHHVAQHFAQVVAQVIEALRIGGAIVCCVAGTVTLALTLRHVNESAKASAAVRAAAARQHDHDVSLAPARDPLSDTGLPATSDAGGEPALAAVPGGTDADELAAHADWLANDRVLLLGGADGSIRERVRS